MTEEMSWLLPVALIKHHDQGNVQKQGLIETCGSKGLESMMVELENMATGGRHGGLELEADVWKLTPQTASKKQGKQTRDGMSLQTLKAYFQGHMSSSKAMPPQLPTQCTGGEQTLKCLRL